MNNQHDTNECTTTDEIIVPDHSERLVELYVLLATQMVGQSVNNILYPCCGTDITPSIAFPDASVQYIDLNEKAMQTLKAHGYKAKVGKVPTGRSGKEFEFDENNTPVFTPDEPVDLLILLNPQISPYEIIRHVRHEGYVLCNNYHRTADEMYDCKEFTPLAMAENSEAPKLHLSPLDDYFQLIATDSEYIKMDPERYAVIQQYIYGKIRPLFPRLFNVNQAIPKFLKQVQGEMEIFDSVFLGNATLPKPLRKKWSSTASMFLFQKTK